MMMSRKCGHFGEMAGVFVRGRVSLPREGQGEEKNLKKMGVGWGKIRCQLWKFGEQGAGEGLNRQPKPGRLQWRRRRRRSHQIIFGPKVTMDHFDFSAVERSICAALRAVGNDF